jgi:hypothetical protein
MRHERFLFLVLDDFRNHLANSLCLLFRQQCPIARMSGPPCELDDDLNIPQSMVKIVPAPRKVGADGSDLKSVKGFSIRSTLIVENKHTQVDTTQAELQDLLDPHLTGTCASQTRFPSSLQQCRSNRRRLVIFLLLVFSVWCRPNPRPRLLGLNLTDDVVEETE